MHMHMCRMIVAATGGCCVAAESLSGSPGRLLRIARRAQACLHTHTYAADHTVSLICWVDGGMCLKQDACM